MLRLVSSRCGDGVLAPTTRSQPAHGHGGPARSDEEVTVTLLRRRAALDAWLEHAEALLADRPETGDPEGEAAPGQERSDAA
jgi:hypothetical protein